jgi:hypothetical protein
VRLAFLTLVLLAACKEEYTQHDIHVLNPIEETDDTDPAPQTTSADATTDTTTTIDAGADAPSDARADVRDATGQ